MQKTIKNIFSSVLILAVAQSSVAQSFNEMSYMPERTTFTVNSPDTARCVMLRIYEAGQGGNPIKTVRMIRSGQDKYSASIDGNLEGKFYTFDVDAGNGFLGETPGVFAKAVGVNGKRGAIIQMDNTDPEGWESDKSVRPEAYTDWIIYELHNRDYSISSTSSLKNKGKFLALAEPEAISHLLELGVNAVHLLPSFDYASVDETRLDIPQYNWGYDPVNYNVPEGSYSTDPYDPETRIKEFKTMVMALHKAGIKVILDVVYNHTFDITGSGFQRTWPDYYYRKTTDGQYSNGSGCGNETASERALMRDFITESVLYWIKEYHIDGFRFDLMGVHDIETMNHVRAEVDKIDPRILIYGEGWSAGQCAYPGDKLATKAHTGRMKGIAAFSDELRDALRGPFSDDTKGAFLAGLPGSEESIKFGIAGAISHPGVDMSKVNYSKEAWAEQPGQMISYVSCHDDMCLTDRLRASITGIGDDELARLDMLAQTAVFTSQGIPFILSGEEMMRTKRGVHNSYNSPDSINELDWTGKERHRQVFDYYKGLISMRKNHPAFRLGDADAVREHLDFLETGPCVVGFRLTGHAGGDSWGDIYVLLNSNREAKTVSIPEGRYTVVCRNGRINETGLGTIAGGQITVGAQEALIFHK